MESHGYKVNKFPTSYIGETEKWQVENRDEKYQSHVEKFLSENKESSETKLSPDYENFKHDFFHLQRKINGLSEKFRQFEGSLNDAACQKQISDPSKLIENFNNDIFEMKKLLAEAQKSIEITKSMKVFYELPKKVYEKCENEKQIQSEIDENLNFLKGLNWSCLIKGFTQWRNKDLIETTIKSWSWKFQI